MTELPDDLPATVRAELTRLRAERTVYVAERERLLDELRAADRTLRDALDRQRQLAADAQLTEETRSRAAETEAVRADLTDLRRQRDELRAELAGVRAERDRARLTLLDAELLLHGSPTVATAETGAATNEIARRAEVAELRAAALERELTATRETISWRVTAPLRAIRRRVPRR